MRSSIESRYVINPNKDDGSSGWGIAILTAGSQGLWIVDVLDAQGVGFTIQRVSGWDGDVTPISIFPLREGDTSALSTCADGSEVVSFDWGAMVCMWLAAGGGPMPPIGRLHPVYVAPGNSVVVSGGPYLNVYLSEG